MPLAASASSISCSRFSSTNCRGDKLTAIDTGRNPQRCHAMFCAQASIRTQRPIGTIRPVSSASGMNWAGGKHAVFGMGPAQQRLDAGDLAGRQIHLRLIVQRELLALQRMAQAVFQRQAFDRLHLRFLGEEAEIVLAVFLGEIHRRIGALGQRMHVGAVGREHGDADAGRGVAFDGRSIAPAG